MIPDIMLQEIEGGRAVGLQRCLGMFGVRGNGTFPEKRGREAGHFYTEEPGWRWFLLLWQHVTEGRENIVTG